MPEDAEGSCAIEVSTEGGGGISRAAPAVDADRPPRLVSALDWLVRAEGVTALVLLAAPPALALAAALYSALNEDPALAYTLVIVATQLAGIAVVTVLLRRHARPAGRDAPAYRKASIDLSYRIDRADPRRHSVTSRETVVAEADGVTHVDCECFWTGTGPQGKPAVSGDPDVKPYYADLDHPLEDFRLFFGGEGGLAAGEARSYTVSAELYDEEGTFKPFLRQRIHVPTDRVRLVVALPPEDFPRFFAEVRGPRGAAARPVPHALTVYPEVGIALLEIDSPTLGAEYSLEWFPPAARAGADAPDGEESTETNGSTGAAGRT